MTWHASQTTTSPNHSLINSPPPSSHNTTHTGLPLLNDLLLNYSGRALLRVLELLSDKERYPIALYCTAGKDRTGLVILLLLSALGVDPHAIAEDYVLSDTAYEDLNDEKALVGALEQVGGLVG